MKICHIDISEINSMPRVWREAFSAKNNGFEVVVVGAGNNSEYNGIHFFGIRKAKNRMSRILINSRRMVKLAIKQNPDIIELHSPELLIYALSIKKKRIKVIFNSHEFYAYQILDKGYIPSFLRGFISKGFMAVEKYVCSRIDGVIYPCTVLGKNYFEDISKKNIKIENYSAPIEIDECEKVPNSMIYAGTLSESRGITTLVNVMNKLECKLYLCGKFSSDEYRDYIFSIADPNKLEYLGVISREELMKYYSKCIVGVSLLKKVVQYDRIDNLSTKMYEYMQCKMPIVCTDFRYAKLMNDKYNFGIAVNPDDEDEICSAIKTIMSDNALAIRLGENGHNAFLEAFNWQNEEEKLMNFYYSI